MHRRLPGLSIAGFLICACTVLAGGALAHPGHGAELSREQAVTRALGEVRRLASAGKIETSWQNEAQLRSADLRAGKHAPEWVVVFSNPAAQEPSHGTLYVFLNASGAYLAANFTGN